MSESVGERFEKEKDVGAHLVCIISRYNFGCVLIELASFRNVSDITGRDKRNTTSQKRKEKNESQSSLRYPCVYPAVGGA